MQKYKFNIKVSSIVREKLEKWKERYYQRMGKNISWNDMIELILDNVEDLLKGINDLEQEKKDIEERFQRLIELYTLEDGTILKPPNY